MFTIQNEVLSVTVNDKGAELDRIYHKTNQLDYLWDGNPAFWAKKSPVLFPIVGTLKGDKFFYSGKDYQLGRHGFARERSFNLVEQTEHSVSFSLEADAVTLSRFPFLFRFKITYSLELDQLVVRYEVYNKDETPMYFSVGGHPAFKLPLVEGTRYEDYYLWFNKVENAGRWPISPEGLIEEEPESLLENSDWLMLSKELFFKDAIVFKHLESTRLSLKSDKSSHGLDFDFTGFPYLGIWAARGADFVCIEPWCGIADSVDSNQQLTDKEGIVSLAPGEPFKRQWKARFY